MGIAKRLAAEFIGTAMLLAIGGGAGIAAQRLAGGDAAMALLISALVGAAGLALLILTFGHLSGGLFNPVLTLSEAWRGNLRADYVAPYIVVQAAGAVAGVAAVHAAYGLDLMLATQQVHTGTGQWLGEFAATFGLLCVFIGCGRVHPMVAPFAVSAYVVAACCFSTSPAFMNPAMTLARAIGQAGALRMVDAPAFMLSQLAGAAAATAIFMWLHGRARGALPGPAARDGHAG
jgi:glycerol uptake facilitator-like aquaporin